MYLIIVFRCTAAMDKTTSFLCWTVCFIILHGKISCQPIYENHRENPSIINRTDSYCREVYGKQGSIFYLTSRRDPAVLIRLTSMVVFIYRVYIVVK